MSQATAIQVAPAAAGRAAGEPLFSTRDLRKLIIPLMAEQTLALTVGMIDTLMIASVGEQAVSGVSLVETINLLLITLFTALAAGGAIVAGQYLGKRDLDNANHAAKQLVFATFSLSTVIAILCIALNGPILSLVFGGIEADVMAHAKTYFYLTALSYPCISLYNASAALFRGMGNSNISMVNALIMNLINIVGNSIFIFGFKWGVFGAALSTLLSRLIAACTMIWMLRNRDLPIYVRSYHPRDVDFSMIRRILKIGIPNSVENSMFQIGKILLASLVTLYGTTAITANAVGNSIAMIAIIPGSAIGLALITVVSRCVGAGEYGQAKRYTKRLIKSAYLYILILNVLILLGVNLILRAFQLSPETTAATTQILIVHGIFAIVVWPLSFSLPNAFRAAGDVKFTMVVSVLSMWIFRIGLSYLFALLFDIGVLGVWIAMVVDWCFRSVCFTWRYLSGKWQRKSLVG